MPPSTSSTLFASILFVACLATLVYARALHKIEGVPNFGSDIGIGGSNDEVPWPGIQWLEKLSNIDGYSFTLQGRTYNSAYEAMLHPFSNSSTNPVKNFNAYVNSFIIPHYIAKYVVQKYGIFWSHHIITYLRNLIAGTFVYFGTGAFFHYHCYIHPRSKEIFKNRKRPEWSIMVNQMKLAQASLFIYVLLPGFSEFLIEEGFTKSVYTFDELGGFRMYLMYTVLYFALVEIGIYWMHRTLHTNKTLYKYIHLLHHSYSAPHTLTPWCSIAFHPLDGILQASPYVVLLPFVPTHYLTHIGMVFLTAVWATYIHDAMDWNVDPIMGSKYHTVHHTHYIYNYGQIFTFCDRIWGTLRIPMTKTGVQGERVQLKVVDGWFGKGRGGKAKSS